ncbi:MAG: toxin glutamine deamidase domain-containing protein [Acidimicrobiales bacterium]
MTANDMGTADGLAAMVSPGRLATFVVDAARSRTDLSDAEAAARAAATFGGAVAVLDAVVGLVGRQEGTERYVDGVIASARSADQPPGGSPWLDGDTDSWVVGLVRAAAGLPTPGFISRVADDGPGVWNELLEAGEVLDPAAQARLLVTDPDQFRSNWSRFFQGGADFAVDTNRSFGLVHSAGNPFAGLLYTQRTGRAAPLDLLAGAAGLAHQAAYDPDQLASDMVQWPALRDDPYWWAGYQGAQVASEVATSAVTGASLGLVDDMAPTVPPARAFPVVPEEVPLLSTVDGLGSSPPIGPRPGPGADGRWAYPDLDWQRLAEPEWLEPGPIRSHRAGPGEHPATWIDDVNHPGKGTPGRSQNCVDCTRAVEANWRGQDAVAAPIRPERTGVSLSYLEDWAGGMAEATDVAAIQTRLQELGPGSSAMVAAAWSDNSGHAFSAMNVNGEVLWVDGQSGIVAAWPPDYPSAAVGHVAVFIGPEGTPVRPINVPPPAVGGP